MHKGYDIDCVYCFYIQFNKEVSLQNTQVCFQISCPSFEVLNLLFVCHQCDTNIIKRAGRQKYIHKDTQKVPYHLVVNDFLKWGCSFSKWNTSGMPHSSKVAPLVAPCKEFQREKTSRLPDGELTTAFHCLRGNFQIPMLTYLVVFSFHLHACGLCVCVYLHIYSSCLHVPVPGDPIFLHYCRGKHAARVLAL